jgi:hypothetical protein
MICRQGKSPAGNSIDGVIGDRDTRGASLRLTSGDDTPQALLGALSTREGVNWYMPRPYRFEVQRRPSCRERRTPPVDGKSDQRLPKIVEIELTGCN